MAQTCDDSKCASCSSNCSSRKAPMAKDIPHELTKVKKIIGIVSGKGGVGKSLVTSLLSVMTSREGKKVAIMDADITGPSIPKCFGITEKAYADDNGLLPCASKTGIKVMSTNLLLENDTDPVIWRGPVIAGMVKQFWTDVVWGDVDYMFVDMPPGTGDVPLTVFQSMPIDGIVIVTSPQELVSMIVEKAVNMANMMNVPILGLVENMSYIKCPDCDKKIEVFGESKIEEIAKQHAITVFDKLPIDSKIAKACDEGMIEFIENGFLLNVVNAVVNL